MSKFKFTWGHGIIVALACFMIFITSLVFFAGNMGEMVEDNYYEKTVVYQNDIDAAKRANEMSNQPEIVQQANGFLIRFKENPETGNIRFLRSNNSEFDVKAPLKLNNRMEQLIHSEDLEEGQYEVDIRWIQNGQDYLIKKTVNWNSPSS
jgi:hemin uptake protein HemP